jgi:hypothetical protein
MSIDRPDRHRRPAQQARRTTPATGSRAGSAQQLVTIECHDCQIPFDRMSSYGEAELLAGVHDRLWHRGRAEATVVVLDLVVLDLAEPARADPVALRSRPPFEPARLAS